MEENLKEAIKQLPDVPALLMEVGDLNPALIVEMFEAIKNEAVSLEEIIKFIRKRKEKKQQEKEIKLLRELKAIIKKDIEGVTEEVSKDEIATILKKLLEHVQ